MSIENVVTKKGEVNFVWLNHYAGLAIKTPTKIIVIDPVDVNSKQFRTVDALLLTHEHYDHLDQSLVKDLHSRTNCVVIADSTSTKRLRNAIPEDKLREAKVGLEFKIGEVSIKAEKCNHPPAATPLTYVITTEDGIRIYHTADSLPFPEMKQIGEKAGIDVVFCTVGIAPGASPKTGVEIAKLLQPKTAVPYHTASASDLKRFAEILSKEAPNVKCMLVESGKIYKYP
ncbi:MAG: MBL fold metallo-hydrolase [Candidatus Bathyarchaeia archaeon]